MKKQYISWDEFQAHVANICQQISASKWRPAYVVGLTRGGLLPATMISHWLGVPMKSLDVSLQDHFQCVSNCGMAKDAYNDTNILIVDDINDSGATLEWIADDWRSLYMPTDQAWVDSIWNHNVKIATIVDNLSSNCRYNIDFTSIEINKAEENVWIEFPYENWWKAKV